MNTSAQWSCTPALRRPLLSTGKQMTKTQSPNYWKEIYSFIKAVKAAFFKHMEQFQSVR